jgi:hypothetical protein
MRLVDDFQSWQFTAVIFSYFVSSLRYAPFTGFTFNWVDQIFQGILRLLSPTIPIGGKSVPMVSESPLDASFLAKTPTLASGPEISGTFIASLLAPNEQGDAVLDWLEKLLTLLYPLLTPPGEQSTMACSFVRSVASGVLERLSCEASIDRKKVHGWQYLTAQQRQRFVDLVVPFVKRALVTCPDQKLCKGFYIVPVALAGLSFRLVRDEIFEFAIDHMVDAEASPLSVRCNGIVTSLMLAMFEGDHFQDNAEHLPQIIENAVANFGVGSGPLVQAAFKILSAISPILAIPADLGTLPDKYRRIARAFLSSFEPALRAAIRLFCAEAPVDGPETAIRLAPLPPVYFASFPTSFIESELTFLFRAGSDSAAYRRSDRANLPPPECGLSSGAGSHRVDIAFHIETE